MVSLGNVDNTSDANKPASTATSSALALKANTASPTFTGTVSGITAAMVGLGSVNNTSDAGKPISTATQTALDGKANIFRFALPDTGGDGTQWCKFGTLATAQGGRLFRLELVSQAYFGNFYNALLSFATSNSVTWQLSYDTTTQVYASAMIQTTTPAWTSISSDWAVQQNSSSSYSFWVKVPIYNGIGYFIVETNALDTFTYDGSLAASYPMSAGINVPVTNATAAQGKWSPSSFGRKAVPHAIRHP